MNGYRNDNSNYSPPNYVAQMFIVMFCSIFIIYSMASALILYMAFFAYVFFLSLSFNLLLNRLFANVMLQGYNMGAIK